MMSPRDIDVAYVLEGLPGVLGVYAVRGRERIRYAIHLDTGGYAVAQAHYALLRAFTHEECAAVAVYQVELPAVIRASATRLALTEGARAEARARVPLTTPALEQTLAAARPRPQATHDRLSVLIVDDDEDIAAAAAEAFGQDARWFVIADPFAALWEAKARRFDAILCDVDRAFGVRGFVSNLVLDDPERAQRVILIMKPHGVREPRTSWLNAERLRKPATAADLRNITSRAIAGIASSPTSTTAPLHRRRVLLIDETASRVDGPSFAITLARNGWEALERIHEDWALVICSLTMRTDSGTRVYSLLWKACPAIKSRFALLVDHPDDANRVLTRPLTAAAVTAMLDHLDRPA